MKTIQRWDSGNGYLVAFTFGDGGVSITLADMETSKLSIARFSDVTARQIGDFLGGYDKTAKEIDRLRAVVHGLELYNSDLIKNGARLLAEKDSLEARLMLKAQALYAVRRKLDETELELAQVSAAYNQETARSEARARTIAEIMKWRAFNFSRLLDFLRSAVK